MKEIRIEVWGIFSLNRKQIMIFELVFLTIFICITAFLFSYDFKAHLENESYTFHATYAKYFSLACTFLIIVEAQYLWSKFTQAQLNLIKAQNKKIENQNKEIILQNAELKAQKEEILVQNEMLHTQKEEILEKQKKIEMQNNDIRDSIAYASRIQSILLPSKRKIARLLDSYFIYFKPKDVVSGDFYWIEDYGQKTIIAVADCTGHGVPGAFVSIMGLSFLNDIVLSAKANREDLKPGSMLDQLRDKLLHAISNAENEDETYDGMDISVCIIDHEEKKYEYAGALLSVYHTSKPSGNSGIQIEQLKPDVFPVSMMKYEHSNYNNTTRSYENGDMLYLFTDGFADQFGGADGRKFLNVNFKNMILSIAGFPVEKQMELLDVKLHTWKGSIDQIDDITIVGIKL
ncbi:MAG: SpoIIE family protein phosphatase [Bacteroidales bacterium]